MNYTQAQIDRVSEIRRSNPAAWQIANPWTFPAASCL